MSSTPGSDRPHGLTGTIKTLQSEVRRLRKEVAALRAERDSVSPLPRLQDLAGELSVSTQTVRRRLEEADIPIRDAHGYPKKDGDRTTAHVSRAEWEAKGELETRRVRKAAGFYDD